MDCVHTIRNAQFGRFGKVLKKKIWKFFCLLKIAITISTVFFSLSLFLFFSLSLSLSLSLTLSLSLPLSLSFSLFLSVYHSFYLSMFLSIDLKAAKSCPSHLPSTDWRDPKLKLLPLPPKISCERKNFLSAETI